MIQNILEWLDTQYIDFMMFWLVIAAGFMQQRLLAPFTWYKKDARYDGTLKTLVVSMILCGLYTWLVKYEANVAPDAEQKIGVPWLKIFISFSLATSFYDLIIRLFKIEYKKRTGQDADEISKP